MHSTKLSVNSIASATFVALTMSELYKAKRIIACTNDPAITLVFAVEIFPSAAKAE